MPASPALRAQGAGGNSALSVWTHSRPGPAKWLGPNPTPYPCLTVM